jgi:hypothetical protein
MIRTRRDALLGAGALLAAPALAKAGADPQLNFVLERHTGARGGRKALDAVRSLGAELEITEGGSTVQASYLADVSGRMRIDVFAGAQRVWSEGLDQAGAWAWPGDKPEPVPESESGAHALKHGVEFNLFGLHRLPERGARLSLAGREMLDGVDYYVIQLVLADGFTTYRYISPKTWMIERGRDVRALHPDADPTQKLLENVYEDFRPSQGVMVSFRSRQVDVASGQVLQRTMVRSNEFNGPGAALGAGRAYRPAKPSV